MAKFDRKPAEKVALAGLLVQLVATVMAFIFAQISGAATVRLLFWQALISVPVWLMVLVHLRQARQADDEGVEWDRLEAERATTGARGRLFEADEIQAFSARNRLRFFERFLQPGLAAFLVICLGLLVLLMFVTGTLNVMRVRAATAVLSLVFMLPLVFVLFLIAYYAAGMARERAWRSLRAGAGFMLLTMLFGVAAVVGLGFGSQGIYVVDTRIAQCMLAVWALLGVEVLLNFVLDFYRPRVEGVETRASFDSRLLSLLSEPGGVLKTVGDTLDYQFGFKISQTWVYQFAEQMIAPFVLFLILALYGLTCFEIVNPEERGVLERFGEYQRVVRPGLVVKLPWPIDIISRFPAARVNVFGLGHAGERTVSDKILWTRKHYETEFETMVAAKEAAKDEKVAPVSLIVASARVRYKVKDDDQSIYDWYYQCANPAKLVEALCGREQQKYLAGVDYYEVMGHGRQKASESLRELMQAAVDKESLGVEVLGVGLEEIHPPIGETTGLVEAYHKVIQAKQQREVEIFKAKIAAVKEITDADIMKIGAETNAREKYAEKAYLSEAEAQRFNVRIKVFKDVYEVFAARELATVMMEQLKGIRKIVVVPQVSHRHMRLNLEDPAGGDMGTIEFEKTHVSGDESDKGK